MAEEMMLNIDEEAENHRFRKLQGPAGTLARIFSIGLPVLSVLFIMDLFTPLGLFVYSTSYNAIFLAIVLSMVFLLVPASPSAPKLQVPWYDWLLLLAGAAGNLYLAGNYEAVIMQGGVGVTFLQKALGLATILVLLEAGRRTLGWTMVIITLFFLAHAKFTYLFPGPLNGPQFSLGRVLSYIYLSDQGIFGMVMGITSTIIISFMTFGAFLSASGAGEMFLKLALALMGHVRGGAAKVAIVASALFGTLTGSPMAEVGLVGTVTIPLMKRLGYSPAFAGAVEAAAACGGVIMPPVMGAVAFVMADFTGLGYAKVAIAAIIPAVLYFLALYFQLDLRAAATGLVGLPKAELPTWREALGGGRWVLFIPLMALIFLMMVLQYDPTRAIYVSLLLLLVAWLFKRDNRLSWQKFVQGLEASGRAMLDITPITGLAGVIVGSVTLTGLGLNLSGMLVEMAGGSLLLLTILTGIASYVLGMGISAITTYILLALLVAPAMAQVGVPALVSHFFIFYMGVSMFITPPYAPAAYIAGSIAGASPFRVGYQAMRLAIVAYLVPFISVFQPALLGVGSPLEIAVAAVTAVVATFALSVGLEGYFIRPLAFWERGLWLAGGILLFIPSSFLILPGLLLLAAGTLVQFSKRGRHATQVKITP